MPSRIKQCHSQCVIAIFTEVNTKTYKIRDNTTVWARMIDFNTSELSGKQQTYQYFVIYLGINDLRPNIHQTFEFVCNPILKQANEEGGLKWLSLLPLPPPSPTKIHKNRLVIPVVQLWAKRSTLIDDVITYNLWIRYCENWSLNLFAFKIYSNFFFSILFWSCKASLVTKFKEICCNFAKNITFLKNILGNHGEVILTPPLPLPLFLRWFVSKKIWLF